MSKAEPDAMRRPNQRSTTSMVAAGIVALLLIIAPFSALPTGGLLGGDLVNSPSSLQTLALCLTIGALAMSYDVIMGYTGLFSFGHALFFAIGSYAFAMLLTLTELGFTAAVLGAVLVTVIASVALNAIALRATAIAFSMVTLALVQLASTIIGRNYLSTGGENGIPLPGDRMPSLLVGVFNAQYVYWLAVALFIVVFAIASYVTSTRMGRVWQAIRENELRVSVMGLNTYMYKLAATVVGSTLAGLCGVVYAIVIGTADPTVTTLFYSLGLVLMVVIGGKGRVWGAALGGILYTLLQVRLPEIAATDAIDELPAVLRIPLEGPQILIGLLFIFFIFVIPGGLAGLLVQVGQRLRGRHRGGGGTTVQREGETAPLAPQGEGEVAKT
jgi:branched-chain amino acid transport system permease protein